MKDPLKLFLQERGFHADDIKSITKGAKYTAVVLKNGNIGVAANLSHHINADITDLTLPDLNNLSHRNILLAYFNAVFNYEITYQKEVDIFNHIDFRKLGNIVMTCYFRPLVQKFLQAGIKLKIFDFLDDDPLLSPLSEHHTHLQKADLHILTSTSIFNNSFSDVMANTQPACRTFLLGPSTPLYPGLLESSGIEMLFGAVFKPNDLRVLEKIKAGEGTKSFLPFGKKVVYY